MSDIDEKLSLTLLDPSGGRMVSARAPKNIIIYKLIRKYIDSQDIYRDQKIYYFTNERTNTVLDSQNTLEQADVQDKDVLRLRILCSGGGGGGYTEPPGDPMDISASQMWICPYPDCFISFPVMQEGEDPPECQTHHKSMIRKPREGYIRAQ